MFGIVLAKLLLCKDDVDDKELFDYRKKGITEQIECSQPAYLQLINLW
jgi:hypothetical protein